MAALTAQCASGTIKVAHHGRRFRVIITSILTDRVWALSLDSGGLREQSRNKKNNFRIKVFHFRSVARYRVAQKGCGVECEKLNRFKYLL